MRDPTRKQLSDRARQRVRYERKVEEHAELARQIQRTGEELASKREVRARGGFTPV